MGTTKLEIKVVSKNNREICEAINNRADRGVTLISAEGGYLHNQTQIVFTVISHRELAKMERLIHEIDPMCFMVVTQVNEVSGKGFSMPKNYLEPEE